MPILYPASNRFKYARSASGFRERRRSIQTPSVPVAMTSPLGVVFVTPEGKMLIRLTQGV